MNANILLQARNPQQSLDGYSWFSRRLHDSPKCVGNIYSPLISLISSKRVMRGFLWGERKRVLFWQFPVCCFWMFVGFEEKFIFNLATDFFNLQLSFSEWLLFVRNEKKTSKISIMKEILYKGNTRSNYCSKLIHFGLCRYSKEC